MNAQSGYPYQEIVGDLVASTMRAQAILVSAHLAKTKKPLSNFHGHINKQFSWLALEFREGINRHFFDAPEPPLTPLRVAGLRGKRAEIPKAVMERLKKHLAPDDKTDGVKIDRSKLQQFWQDKPTRISSLIMVAFEEDIKSQSREFRKNAPLSIRSPLAIVYDFLTIPKAQGSRAYALLSLRNYLFSELNAIPCLGADDNGFTVHNIELEISTITTSLRDRYFSRGADKLSVGPKNSAVVRHYLAMRGVLRLFFKSASKCESYLQNGRIIKSTNTQEPYPFEFERSPRLEKLPEVGEIVNELFGLPLPIRGADSVFRGGLKFSNRGGGGLVMAIHGGPGCGKTSLALSFGAHLAPFGIQTLFITGEEHPDDLYARLPTLVPEDYRRLDFFEESMKEAFVIEPLPRRDHSLALDQINIALGRLKESLNATQTDGSAEFCIRKPCRAIVVLDGLHDFFADKIKQAGGESCAGKQVEELYKLIESAKDSGALVILTTGGHWIGDTMLDYLVDIAIQLTHDSVDQYGLKPDRRIRLSKTRYQLCAAGTHGMQIAGNKGVRFSPQINYQLERRSIWKVAFPSRTFFKKVLQKVIDNKNIRSLDQASGSNLTEMIMPEDSIHAPRIFCDSHVFINGQGSGGKAPLALKIAMTPSYSEEDADKPIFKAEKVLVVSFLYPKEYYEEIFLKLKRVIVYENPSTTASNKILRLNARMEVIRFYPGHLKPNDLYNRIEWELDSAELYGDPYTCVIIDGIHNVFLQFPEIERYKLLWPQIYNSLRSRSIMIISTHTTLSVPRAIDGAGSSAQLPPVDDSRSEPLRHALVQKSDFQFELDSVPHDLAPYKNNEVLSSLFALRTMSAIGQPIPKGYVLWSRESFVFIEAPPLD